MGMEKAADCAKDVSVISCDQFFTAEYMVPRLTSVDQHNALFGQFVIKALLSAMEGGRENVLLRYDPELIIRPSGEMRTSNFLLWQSAYSEYVFMDVLWPDFGPEDLDKAIAEYHRRSRRFGGV